MLAAKLMCGGIDTADIHQHTWVQTDSIEGCAVLRERDFRTRAARDVGVRHRAHVPLGHTLKFGER